LKTSPSLAIVTGVSRGLGEALALDLLARGYAVLGIGRSDSQRLAHARYRFVRCDLGDASNVDEVLARPFEEAAAARPPAATLINNAATADPVGVFGRMTSRDIAGALATNLSGPAAVANCFCRVFSDDACERRIINVSSGAAERSVPGIGVYSIAKAGLEMLTQSLVTEHADDGLSAITLRPGVIDTDMQVHARSQPREVLPSVELFQEFHAGGQLVPPAVVARKTIDRLVEGPIETGRTYNYAEL
jgi:NAD(P)-dependent dehydrogenase (short-subunit alcohol dehydrogenase family)